MLLSVSLTHSANLCDFLIAIGCDFQCITCCDIEFDIWPTQQITESHIKSQWVTTETQNRIRLATDLGHGLHFDCIPTVPLVIFRRIRVLTSWLLHLNRLTGAGLANTMFPSARSSTCCLVFPAKREMPIRNKNAIKRTASQWPQMPAQWLQHPNGSDVFASLLIASLLLSPVDPRWTKLPHCPRNYTSDPI